jgi:hypothetical protein
MNGWLAGLAFWQLGLLWLLASLVWGLIAGRVIHRGNPMDEAEERRHG